MSSSVAPALLLALALLQAPWPPASYQPWVLELAVTTDGVSFSAVGVGSFRTREDCRAAAARWSADLAPSRGHVPPNLRVVGWRCHLPGGQTA